MWLFLLFGFILVVLTFVCSKDPQQKTGRSCRAKGKTFSPSKQKLKSSSSGKKPKAISTTTKGTSSESKTVSKETVSKETPPPAMIPVVKSKEVAKGEEPKSSDVPLRPKAQPPTDPGMDGITGMNEKRPARPNLTTSGTEQEALLPRLDPTQKSSWVSKKRKTSDKSETAKEHSGKKGSI